MFPNLETFCFALRQIGFSQICVFFNLTKSTVVVPPKGNALKIMKTTMSCFIAHVSQSWREKSTITKCFDFKSQFKKCGKMESIHESERASSAAKKRAKRRQDRAVKTKKTSNKKALMAARARRYRERRKLMATKKKNFGPKSAREWKF